MAGQPRSFRKLRSPGENNWSLLVQAVNHWHEPTAALMRPFRALPDWRMDDLMISFSVPGGGVGPHLDQYDVFIIQGTGRRRWRVGEKVPMKQHCPHPDLLQVDPFEGIIDEELEPGDILYIPPDSRMKATRWKTRSTIRRLPRAKRPRDDQRLCRLCSAANWAASATRSGRAVARASGGYSARSWISCADDAGSD
jgi:hypothetical protein